MAGVDVTISGVLYDKLNRTSQQVVLIGEGSLTGLGVGGGPMPPGPGKPPIDPPGIWGGPIDPHPDHGLPQPPGRPDQPPPIDPDTPPVTWKPIWTPTEGWVVVGIIEPNFPHPAPSTK